MSVVPITVTFPTVDETDTTPDSEIAAQALQHTDGSKSCPKHLGFSEVWCRALLSSTSHRILRSSRFEESAASGSLKLRKNQTSISGPPFSDGF